MVRLTGQMGVPVIVVDDEVIIGFDRQRLGQLIAASNSDRPVSLGLRVADASRMFTKIGSTPVPGAYIGSVKPNSPADNAGLKSGDIITSLNLKSVKTAADIENNVSLLKPGSTVMIAFLRGQETLTAKLNL